MRRLAAAIALSIAVPLGAAPLAARAAPPPDSPAGQVAAAEARFPPWQEGANDDAAGKGFDFTVPPINSLADFHGSLDRPKLVLFIAGNYYFALPKLIAAFGKAYPAYAGHIYYETLPPGVLEAQMRAGGTVTSGNMTWSVMPDVYLAGMKKVEALIKAGLLTGKPVPYVTNDLTIMVPKDNPGHVTGLADLGRADVPLVMPNPRYEGVARQIRASLVKAGGEALAQSVYEAKVKEGTTILTRVHHRQTPLFLMEGFAQAGVTWTSEAIFQEQVGHPISNVAIPAGQNTTAIYAAAVATHARHEQAARDWMHFITSDAAIAVFESYGFKRYAQK